MKSKLGVYFTIVLCFALANMLLGRLFHESLNLVCFSELFIVGATSILFWSLTNPLVEKASQKWNPFESKKNLAIQTGLGFSLSGLNILVSHVVIILAMLYVYKCTSPGFDIVNASLTNNIALNIFCYSVLTLLLIKSKDKIESSNVHLSTDANNQVAKILLSSNNKCSYVEADDINFIETSNNCIVINTNRGKFVKYQSLKSFLLEHNLPQFKRIHRSFAVNTHCIESVEKNNSGDGYVFLSDNSKIKFSRSFKHVLQN